VTCLFADVSHDCGLVGEPNLALHGTMSFEGRYTWLRSMSSAGYGER
jgi:hypothetical protein